MCSLLHHINAWRRLLISTSCDCGLGHGVKFLFSLEALKWGCLVLNEKLVVLFKGTWWLFIWLFNFLSSRLKQSVRPDGAVRSTRDGTTHAAQAPWGHWEERWIHRAYFFVENAIMTHVYTWHLSYKLCTGLDNPTLYRNFTAGGGLDVRQCFDSGKWHIPFAVGTVVTVGNWIVTDAVRNAILLYQFFKNIKSYFSAI